MFSFQLAEDDRADEGHPAKLKERSADATNEFRGIRTIVVANEEDRHRLR